MQVLLLGQPPSDLAVSSARGTPLVQGGEPLLPAAPGPLADLFVRGRQPHSIRALRLVRSQQHRPRRRVTLACLRHPRSDQALERLLLGHPQCSFRTGAALRPTLAAPAGKGNHRPASRGQKPPLPPLKAGGVSTGIEGWARDSASENVFISYDPRASRNSSVREVNSRMRDRALGDAHGCSVGGRRPSEARDATGFGIQPEARWLSGAPGELHGRLPGGAPAPARVDQRRGPQPSGERRGVLGSTPPGRPLDRQSLCDGSRRAVAGVGASGRARAVPRHGSGTAPSLARAGTLWRMRTRCRSRPSRQSRSASDRLRAAAVRRGSSATR